MIGRLAEGRSGKESKQKRHSPESNINLEQRVEVLEKAVKAFVGDGFSVVGGQLFINEALIQGPLTKSVKAHDAAFGVQLEQIDNAIKSSDNFAQLGSSVSSLQGEALEIRLASLEQNLNDLALQMSSLSSSTQAAIAAIHAAEFKILG
ncbi:hypothetical protein [Pantoea piersonii]|uniref:hypothetical protein n=1 Tax=Pantoea piersonii TaxID=2364647 RepID=UPI0022F17861|nr:hypothetical protein [Pantoea piersonii]WBV20229.1 hypothetical protein PG877_11360 [Pantoea piersonii]